MKNAKGSKSVPKAKAVRSKSATPATDVPGWAKRAAARDTAAEMAAAAPTSGSTETAPTATNANATIAPAPKTARAPKGKPSAKQAKAAATKGDAAKPPAPGSLKAIGEGWLDSLRSAGHTPSTISSYGNDLEIAYEHLGGDAVAAGISEKQIAGFNASAGVTRKASGKPKAQPTILKTRRALRLALVWAADQKLIAKAPYSAA